MLVNRLDVGNFEPREAGRPKVNESEESDEEYRADTATS